MHSIPKNPDHRDMAHNRKPVHTCAEMTAAIRPNTPCVCYFGGVTSNVGIF